MLANEIFDRLKTEFGDAILAFDDTQPTDPFIMVQTDKVFDVCYSLRDNDKFQFDYLMCLTGMDLGEDVGVVYHLYSMKFKHKVVLKVVAPKADPKVPSVEMLWKTADWHEREAYDLMGVQFEGHRNLIRILCPYDWEGHPLRKDYETPEFYHGMKVSY
ncbi:MAG: NADH-quinone oxidoreductase subunit C [Bacteroidales bacterium]|nr:NADH-quinone oxidoreductase subunit C [Bacteroidales bacterium]